MRGPTWPNSGDPGPLLDRFDPWFESIKKVSNRDETWREHSSSCRQTPVKISWHLDQGIERYDRFKIEILGVLAASNRSYGFVRINMVQTHRVESMLL